jgi:hypothetical protein
LQRGKAEDLGGLPRVGAAIIGDAFHYMDRSTVLAELNRVVAAGGFVAIACSREAGAPRPWWHPIIERVVDRHLGTDRYAGPNHRYLQPASDHESILRASPFKQIQVLRVDHHIEMDLEQLVAAQLSYAYSSRAVLGDKLGAFLHDLRTALQAAEPSQRFVARTQACVILGRRDD